MGKICGRFLNNWMLRSVSQGVKSQKGLLSHLKSSTHKPDQMLGAGVVQVKTIPVTMNSPGPML